MGFSLISKRQYNLHGGRFIGTAHFIISKGLFAGDDAQFVKLQIQAYPIFLTGQQ
jgi:hypothetical protein